VDVSVRRSGQSTVVSALAIIGGLALGFGLGLGVGFAMWGPERAPDVGAPADTASNDPAPDARPTANTPDPDTQQLESMEEVWPARHLFISVEGTSPDAEAQDLLASLKPGGVVLTQRNVQTTPQATALIQDIKRAVNLGNNIYDLPLIAVDQEGGVINRLNLATAPGAREIASRRDLDHARQVGKTYAEASVKLGVGVMLAPVLDVFVPGAAARMESRTFGSDEKTVAAMGLWFASGVIEGGVIPVVKHYPGIGGVKSNARRPLPVLNQSTRELASTMYPFAEAENMNIPGILAGHISVPAIDKSDPPRPASLSPTMINTVLRDRWEYEGVILADDIALEAVTNSYSLPDAAVEALASGCDAVIVTETDPAIIRAICDRIEAAVKSGELAGSALRDSKDRLDNWQAWLRSPTALAGTLPNVLPAADTIPTTRPETETEAQSDQPGNDSEIIYTVKAGDVLSKIAAKYDGVSTSDIIQWNSLTNANIRVGQDLTIRVRGVAPPPTEPEVIEVTPAEVPEPEVVELDPEPVDTEVVEVTPVPLEVTEYTVVSGDVLSRIASKFNVTTTQIMEWNGLETSRLSVGQKLTIGAPATDDPEPEIEVVEVEPEVVEEPEPEPEVVELEPEVVELEPEVLDPSTEMTEYTVQNGDVLSRIASKFNVTTKQIMEWNGLEDSRLSIGQKLMIGAPAQSEPEVEVVEVEPEGVEEPEPEVVELEPEVVEEPEPEVVELEPEVVEPDPSSEMTEYTVKGGDVLSRIASKFNVTTKQIMEWNELENSRIRVGQTLTVIPGAESDTPEPDSTPKQDPAPAPDPEPETSNEAGIAQEKHSVQLGETLSGIAAAYGVSVTDIISWNDLDSDAKLQAGRVLTIYVDSSRDQPEDLYGEYVIQSGDSPLSIANQFEISPEELMRINGVTDVNTLVVGQTLRVPKL
jgi:beta-N-acetylhexosaminidase